MNDTLEALILEIQQELSKENPDISQFHERLAKFDISPFDGWCLTEVKNG